MKKVWKIQADGRNLDNSEIISAIFNNRGIDDIGSFLRPNENDLIPFEELQNINKAFDVVSKGINHNDRFLIFADVDVDGCTSGAIMYRYLYNFTNNIDITINQGKEHGVKGYDIKNCNADIIIIADSINENECYQKFINAGKKVVVLDHHIIPDNFRTDVILVSSANNYKNPELSGAGVVWKFCKYFDYMTLNDYADNLTDLATCGLIADMVDITTPENRYICSEGFKKIHNKGIQKINGSYKFDSQSVSFGIAPLINAAQRMNLNETALNLFLTDDESEIKTAIKTLKNAKEEQNEIVFSLMGNITEQAESQIDNKVMFFIIDTDASISGLIGNKLISIYQRPIIVLKETEEGYAGSARGFGVDDFKFVVDSTELAWTGGHENAFGISIDRSNFRPFKTEINEILADFEFEVKQEADIQLDLIQITTELIDSFKTINLISGTGFKPLTVMVSDITNYRVGNMSGGKHLKIVTDDITLIKWNFNGDWDEFDGRPISVIGGLNSSFFGRTFTKQIIMDDYIVKDGD